MNGDLIVTLQIVSPSIDHYIYNHIYTYLRCDGLLYFNSINGYNDDDALMMMMVINFNSYDKSYYYIYYSGASSRGSGTYNRSSPLLSIYHVIMILSMLSSGVRVIFYIVRTNHHV
jgi:hypothetical protein